MLDLMQSTKLLITDYTGSTFDWALSGARIVYFQFDRDTFYNYQLAKGWYDYDKDGFGPVFTELSGVKKYLASTESREDTDKHIRRVEELFRETPRNSCELIFDLIVERLKSENK
jgi:CDP-glycerol glycerophosphotransferase (TagB/SpsB family)